MANIIFNLPYKVKIKNETNNMTNFSIIALSENNEEQNNIFLNYLKEFKNLGVEIHILDVNSSNGFLKTINDVSSINEKFNKDEKNIINIGDIYYDYYSDLNFINSLTNNDMIFVIDMNYNIINLNISEIEKCINEGYNKIEFKNNKNHKYEPICEFYNKTKYTWINNKLQINDNEEIIKCTLSDNILEVDINEFFYNKKNLNNLTVECFLKYDNKEILYLFGMELYKNNLLESAYNEFNRCLNMEDSIIRRSEILTYIGDYYNKIGKEKECLEFYNKAYLECSKIRLPLYRLGYYFYIKQEWDKCIFYTEGCLNIPKIEGMYKNDDIDFMYKDGPYSMLYVAYWWFGDMKKSKQYFDKALEINPYNQIYLGEVNFHYEYTGNNIKGNLSFQETQYLYNESKKVKSILEIYPESGRSTHALLKGCNGLVTVITKNQDSNFIEKIGNPGNLRILNMTTGEAIKILESENQKFDMIFMNKNYNDIINDFNQYWGIFVWERFATRLICGSEYNESKEIIDRNYEISGIEDNIWYRNLSSFEKTIIYKKKI